MDRYFFDKRVIKKGLIKYGIMFLIALPILIGVNVALKSLSFWACVFIDVAILICVVLAGSWISNAIQKSRENKKQQEIDKEKQLQKARRKAKRQAKMNGTKPEPKVEHVVEDVEVITPDEK